MQKDDLASIVNFLMLREYKLPINLEDRNPLYLIYLMLHFNKGVTVGNWYFQISRTVAPL